MKRVICLYRVSTVGQVDHDDIPMQRMRKESAWLFLMPSFDIHTFWLLRHTNFYSYRKCVCPANHSHRAGYPFTSTRVNGLVAAGGKVCEKQM